MTEKDPNQRPRVLVIEDDFETADLILFVLQSSGFAAKAVSDGNSAVPAARAFGPAVIISDLALPNRDGFELAADFKADPGLREVPLVAVSGIVENSLPDRLQKLGFSDYMPKPVTPSTLLHTVCRLLDVDSRAPTVGADRPIG